MLGSLDIRHHEENVLKRSRLRSRPVNASCSRAGGNSGHVNHEISYLSPEDVRCAKAEDAGRIARIILISINHAQP